MINYIIHKKIEHYISAQIIKRISIFTAAYPLLKLTYQQGATPAYPRGKAE
jgi:hypothetical protein